MLRYRIRYSKEGTARFISHLDLLRTFERVVRRAGLPVALTQGFNPHPKMSFGFPLPVGMAGLNEYVDIEMNRDIPPDEIAGSLDRTMPSGLRVTAAVRMEENSPALMALVDRSVYHVRAGPGTAENVEELTRCLEKLMELPDITVSRRKKDGARVEFDIRPGLLALSARQEEGRALVEMELSTGSRLNIRPEEVIEAIRGRCRLLTGGGRIAITRVEITAVGGASLFAPGI